MKVVCLANEEGINGFDIPSDQIMFAKLRAQRDRDKNGILFKVELGAKQKREIRQMLSDGKPKEALKFIKVHVQNNGRMVDFPSDYAAEFAKSWKFIPHYNPFSD